VTPGTADERTVRGGRRERRGLRLPLGRSATGEERDALGRARLDLGFNVAALALILFLAVIFALNVVVLPGLPFSLGAWALVAGTLVVALILRFRLPDELPAWLFGVALAVWGVAVALDIVGTVGPDWLPLTAAPSCSARPCVRRARSSSPSPCWASCSPRC
jgi:hypothetical protein